MNYVTVVIVACIALHLTMSKVADIEEATDGGYIISAIEGYTFDAQCQYPSWYFEELNVVKMYNVVRHVQPCLLPHQIYEDQ